LKYQIAKTTSLAISLAITMIVLATTALPPEVANTIAVLVCALPNYLLTERLVFTRS
jgi:putative flippase GtrA